MTYHPDHRDNRRGRDPGEAQGDPRPDAGDVDRVGPLALMAGGVYIGRQSRMRGLGPGNRLPASPFHNPYRIGDAHDSIPRGQRLTRADVLRLYEAYLRARPFLLRKLPALRGKVLLCWCRSRGEAVTEANRCHGDILLALLAEYTDEQLRSM